VGQKNHLIISKIYINKYFCFIIFNLYEYV